MFGSSLTGCGLRGAALDLDLEVEGPGLAPHQALLRTAQLLHQCPRYT